MKKNITKNKNKILRGDFGYFLKPKTFNPRDARGFTLVELLVSIGLFAVVVSIAMGGFVRALRTQRQIVSLITANSNASLVVEQMAREMRTGINFCGDQPNQICPDGVISFINPKGELITYAFDASGKIGIITRQNGALGKPEPVTAGNVNVRSLGFSRLNNSLFPERVAIHLSISPTGSDSSIGNSTTDIQTTVSSRGFGF